MFASLLARWIPPAIAGLCALSCAAPRVPRPPVAQKICGPEIPGAHELLEASRFILLGEMHGTNEIPYVVGELACHAASLGQPVTVAVELGLAEQQHLDQFLASEGSEDDRRRLFSGTFWQRPYQDGRSSKAILAMLDHLRRIRAAGLSVRVLAYDSPGLESTAHSEAMAQNLIADRRDHPLDTYLVLCGNAHARTVVGAEWDPERIPMGAFLRESEPGLLALDADYAPGQAWTCRPPLPLTCGIQRVTAPRRGKQYLPVRPENQHMIAGPMGPVQRPSLTIDPTGGFQGYRPFVRLSQTRSAEGYDGIFYVGPITPSPPAAVASLGTE